MNAIFISLSSIHVVPIVNGGGSAMEIEGRGSLFRWRAIGSLC